MTTTSQPSKNESSVMPGMPSAVESNTALLPAFGYSNVLLATERLDVEQDLERLVVDLDQLGRVLALVAALGDDGGDGLADVADDRRGPAAGGPPSG